MSTATGGSDAVAGEPAFDSIGLRQGLESRAIQALLVDRDGFVWIAGDNGLHRYDGSHLQSIDRDPERRDTLVSRTHSKLAQTRDAIWILSFSGVLQRLDAMSGAIEIYRLQRADGRLPARGGRMLADHRDRLWIGTDLGLFRFDAQSATALEIALGERADRRVTALALDGARLLVGTVDGALYSVALDGAANVATPMPLGEPSAHSADPQRPVPLAIVADGAQLWLGTDRGLFRYSSAQPVLDQLGLPPAVASGWIDAMLQDRQGRLWISGQHRRGLLRYDPRDGSTQRFRHHADDPHSLASDSLTALTLDAADNLWIGTQRDGVSRLHVAQHGALRYRAGFDGGNSFCALREGAAGRVLVSLCGGSIAELDPVSGQLTSLGAELDRAFAAPVPTLTTHALVADGDGSWWLPTGNLGLLHWDPASGRTQRLGLYTTAGKRLPDPYMNDARLDRAGRLWVASSLGLARLDRERGELVLLDSVETPGLQLGGGVLDIGAGVDGRLWLGTPQGLVRFDPDGGRSERFAHDPQQHQSLSDDFVLAIHTDPAGRVWIGTEAGLNRVDVDADDRVSFQRFGVQHGLPDQTVSAIASDTTGTLWVGTNRGIASFDAGEQRFHAFSAGDGIPDSSVNRRAVLAASDGSVYFGTFSGLLRVFPERLASTGPKALMLSAYELGGRAHINLAGPAPLILETGYTEARVRFQVAAFGDHRRLSYRMTGLESDWTDMNAGLVVGYDPLPSGHYRFEVRQLENDGHWLPPSLSVALTVRPPPWRSQVAYVLYALTAGSALLLLFLVWRRNREREHQHIEELRELATHDTLTLLPNRACFGDELSAALGDGASESPPLALFFIDLDRFKNINDSLGHRFGDLVLVAAARRLNAALPAEARLARLGGDEFTVILPNLQREAEIAAIAQALVDAFATPLQVESSEVVVTLSLGISLAPAHTRDGTLLVQYADSAMYQAKGGGRNAYRFFKPEMIAQVSRRHALETSLRHALELGELSPVYQPLFELDGERLSGAEVLLRWHSAEHGIVAPVEFIPILEETGMIESVGLWLVEDVCGRLKRWRQLAPNLRLAVNVSAHQVIRGELCERLAGMLSSQAIPRNALELEMTESTVMENAARIGEVLGELRALGLTIAIDDFGTGYSSFASLSQLPVDKLKIDKAFIDGVGRDEQANTLCAAIVAMAHNLKLSVVAEGVESELQHRHLQAMGCDEAQGYWYCRPLTLAAFELFLEQGGRPQAPPLAEAAGAPRLRT